MVLSCHERLLTQSFPYHPCTAATLPGASTSKPNVLFIAIDDLNDWIGCLGGHPDVKTPNLDRLAAEGNAVYEGLLRRAFVQSVTRVIDDRYSALDVWRVREQATDAAVLRSEGRGDDAVSHFAAHGYRVVGGGRSFMAASPIRRAGRSTFHRRRKISRQIHCPRRRPVNGMPRTAHFDWGPVPVADSEMGDSKTVDWAARELNKKHDKPFFLACGIYRPHLPWYVPRKYFDMYPADKIHASRGEGR